MPYTIDNPKPIETDFQYRQMAYKQVKRTGMVAMYSVTHGEGRVVNYEVIVIVINKGGIMFGKVIEPYERYPSDADFGRLGWGFQFLPDAEKRFDKLVRAAERAKTEADLIAAAADCELPPT